MLGWLSAAVVVGTLGLMLARPRGLLEAWAAMLGVLAMALIGGVGLSDLASLLAETSDVLLFLLGMMILTSQVERVIQHVSDSRPIEEAGRALGGLVGRGPGRERAETRLRQASSWSEAEVQVEAGRRLEEANQAAEIILTRGRPDREIVRVAEERRASVVALGGGRGLPGRYPWPGPYPLSPVARFVVDHLRCDVLLLRRYVAELDRRP